MGRKYSRSSAKQDSSTEAAARLQEFYNDRRQSPQPTTTDYLTGNPFNYDARADAARREHYGH